MKIPVVLSKVQVDISGDGQLRVDIDGEPYAAEQRLGRSHLRSVIDEITRELGTAVRVEVRESDGNVYSDISLPPQAAEAEMATMLDAVAGPGLHGTGFRPGEEVTVAYVLCTQTAGADGRASVRIPPALLTRSGHRVVLLGMSSSTLAEIEQSA